MPIPERHHRRAAADAGDRAHDLAAFDLRQHHDLAVVDDAEIGGLARQIAQAAQKRQRRRDEIAAAHEGRADRETLPPDMPHRIALIEFDEPALLKRRQQPVRGGGRQSRADRQIGEPIAFLVFGQSLEQRQRPVDGLDGARLGAVVLVQGLPIGPRRATPAVRFHARFPECALAAPHSSAGDGACAPATR